MAEQSEPKSDPPNHGDGDGQMRKERLTDAQAGAVIEHSSRLRSLRQAQDIFTEIGGALGASLNDTLNRVISSEQKRFGAMMRCDAAVCQEVFAGLQAEEASMRRARVEFQEHMACKRESERAKRRLKEAKDTVAKMRKDMRYAESVVVAAEAIKVYSVEEFGKNHKKGGTKEHRKARMEVLERIRTCAELSARQTGAWDFSRHLGIARWLKRMGRIGRSSSRS